MIKESLVSLQNNSRGKSNIKPKNQATGSMLEGEVHEAVLMHLVSLMTFLLLWPSYYKSALSLNCFICLRTARKNSVSPNPVIPSCSSQAFTVKLIQNAQNFQKV